MRTGRYACFKATGATGRPTGPKLRGVAKRLGEIVYSKGELPTTPSVWRGNTWRGVDGGMRRGKAVDAQVSRLARGSDTVRRGAKMLKLTRYFFDALERHGLQPLDAQRVVLDRSLGVATAVDVVCQRDDELVLVELKCGYRGDKASPVRRHGRSVLMNAPLGKAVDCALHRHFAQLAATHALFMRERGTVVALGKKGISTVSAVLLYVDDEATELHELPDWWKRRALRILDAL